MEQYFQSTESLRKLLKRFHEIVDLTSIELDIVRQYLFNNEYPIPNFIVAEYKYTLEYLKDIVLENKFEEIVDLVIYFDILALNAENELKQTTKNFNDDCYLNADSELVIQSHVYKLNSDDHENDSLINWRIDYLNLIDGLYLKCEKDSNSHDQVRLYLMQSKPSLTLKDSYFISGSYRNITKIHAHHFVDVDTSASFYVRNKEKHKLIKFMDLDELSLIGQDKNNYNYFCDVFNDTLVNRFERHYDVLIEQISVEKPIFNEEFKVQLIQWLLFFKLKNADLTAHNSRSCLIDCYNYTLSNREDDFYDSFQELTQKFYFRQFSDKEWVILKSPDRHSWLTTEDPGFSINLNAFISLHEPLNPDPSLVNLEETSLIYFPLSRDYCLRIQPKVDIDSLTASRSELPIMFRPSSDAEFKTINAMTVSTNKEVLISADKQTLEQLFDKNQDFH